MGASILSLQGPQLERPSNKIYLGQNLSAVYVCEILYALMLIVFFSFFLLLAARKWTWFHVYMQCLFLQGQFIWSLSYPPRIIHVCEQSIKKALVSLQVQAWQIWRGNGNQAGFLGEGKAGFLLDSLFNGPSN
jgi:hypothetical protein